MEFPSVRGGFLCHNRHTSLQSFHITESASLQTNINSLHTQARIFLPVCFFFQLSCQSTWNDNYTSTFGISGQRVKHSVEKSQDPSFWYRDPNWQQVTYELVQTWLKNWQAGRLIWFLFSTGLICTGQLVGPSLAPHSRNRMKTGWRDAGEIVLKVTHTAVTSCWTPLSHDCSMEVCKPRIYGLVEHAKRLKKQRERSLCQLLKRKERQGENTYLKVCVCRRRLK